MDELCFEEGSISSLVRTLLIENSFRPLSDKDCVFVTSQDSIVFAAQENVQEQPLFEHICQTKMIPRIYTAFHCLLTVRKPHVAKMKLPKELPQKFISYCADKKVTIKVEYLSTTMRYKAFINACRIGTFLRDCGVHLATPHVSQLYFGAFLTSQQVFNLLSVDPKLISKDGPYGMQCQETSGLFSLQKSLEMWVDLLTRKLTEHSTDFIKSCAKFESFLCTVLFQIIYTLYCINTLCPLLRHNDLHPANIVLKTSNEIVDLVYQVDQFKFIVYVNSSTRLPCVIDFGWSTNGTRTLPVAANVDKNHYIDVHRFINGILLGLEDLPKQCLSSQMWIFLHMVVPTELSVPLNEEKQLFGSLWNPRSKFMLEPNQTWIPLKSEKIGKALIERTTPKALLRLPIFNCFRRQMSRPKVRQQLIKIV